MSLHELLTKATHAHLHTQKMFVWVTLKGVFLTTAHAHKMFRTLSGYYQVLNLSGYYQVLNFSNGKITSKFFQWKESWKILIGKYVPVSTQ